MVSRAGFANQPDRKAALAKASQLKDEASIDQMKLFLQAENLILDNEVKLGDVLKGMDQTVDAIIEQSKSVYGHGVAVYKKANALKQELPGKIIPQYDPELKKLLTVFGQAHEILKVLVNDHKKTEDLEIQFTHGMGKKKKDDAKTKEKENPLSFKKFMRIMDLFTDYSGNIKLHPEWYEPNVDSIIQHITQGTTHAEKRDIIINKLKATMLDIKATYEQLLKQDEDATIFFRKLANDPSIANNKDILNQIIADGEGTNGGCGILPELEDRKTAIKNQLEVINADIKRIEQLFIIESNEKRGFFSLKNVLDRYRSKKSGQKVA